MISKYQQKKIRDFVREQFGLHKNASVKQMVKEFNSPKINVDNFYTQIIRIQQKEQQKKEENKIITNIRKKEQEKKEKAKKKREDKDKELNDFKKSIIVNEKHKLLKKNELQPFIEKISKKLIHKNMFYIQVSVDGEIKRNQLFVNKHKSLSSIAWDIYKTVLCEDPNDYDSSNYITQNNKNKKFNLIISTDDKIPSERLQQKFRDGGLYHCVFDVFQKELQNKYDESNSESSRKRIKQRMNKLDKIRQENPEYEIGVPEDKMEEVCEYAGFNVSIKNLFNYDMFKFNNVPGKTKLEFTNTRNNHIDLNNITWDTKHKDISIEEMNEKVKKIENKEIWGIVNSFKNPSLAKTLDGNFCVQNKNYDVFNEFNKTTGISNYKLNALKYPELNEFIKEGRLINSAPVEFYNGNDINENTKHFDLVKAYTQHHQCRLYQGFPAFITNWCKGNFDLEFIKSHIGIYKFKVIENNNELLIKLGLKKGFSYILTSVDIIDFIENGVIVEIVAGCWGTSFDFEYTEEILDNGNYATWAGKLGVEHKKQHYMFKGDREWASHLKSELGENNVKYFEKEKIIIIEKENTSLFTRHHIFAFITAYTRINMLDIMRNINGTIKKVILDGVYFEGECETDKPYKIKELKEHQYFVNGWYEPTNFNTDSWASFDERFSENNVILAGAGGTGKSYSVFNNKGLTDVLYVVPTHELGKNAKKNYTTIHSLIGEGVKDNRNFKDLHYEPSIIFIDELTMIEGSWVERALKLYPRSKFIIGGDIDKEGIWYQTRNGYSGNFSKLFIPTDWKYYYYTNDYRSLDNQLKELKINIRNQMKYVFTDGETIDNMRMINHIKTIMKRVKFEDAVKQHEEGNIWICGTHQVRNKLKENNITNSFTCHSFQGSTIESEKVFITLDTFEYSMLYTAISRVRHFSQIVIVEPLKISKEEKEHNKNQKNHKLLYGLVVKDLNQIFKKNKKTKK